MKRVRLKVSAVIVLTFGIDIELNSNSKIIIDI